MCHSQSIFNTLRRMETQIEKLSNNESLKIKQRQEVDFFSKEIILPTSADVLFKNSLYFKSLW